MIDDRSSALLIARECFAVRMRRLNRVITKIYDDAVRPYDMTTSQMNVLVAVACLDPARPAAIADELQMDLSTLSRNVERMRRREWIRSDPDPTDARAHRYRLSPEGHRLLEDLLPVWRGAQRKIKEMFAEAELTALMTASERLNRTTKRSPASARTRQP